MAQHLADETSKTRLASAGKWHAANSEHDLSPLGSYLAEGRGLLAPSTLHDHGLRITTVAT